MSTTTARPAPRPPAQSAGGTVARRKYTAAELRRRALVASWKRDLGHDDQAPDGEQ